MLDGDAWAYAFGDGGNDTVVDNQASSAAGEAAQLVGGTGVDTYVNADGFRDENVFESGDVPTSESIFNFGQNDGDLIEIESFDGALYFAGYSSSADYDCVTYDWSGSDTRVHINDAGDTYTLLLRNKQLGLTSADFDLTSGDYYFD